MALGKHYEEIEERWIANTSERYERQVAELFSGLPPRLALPGETYLTRAGRRMEDIEVCEAGQTLDLAVVTTPGAVSASVELNGAAGRRTIAPKADGRIRLPLKRTGTLTLQVSSGGYVKNYTVYVIEPFQAEQLPDFAKLVQILAENPPEWTDATFDGFRRQLEVILGREGIPPLFIHGITEYHFGLFHEERRLASFRERLQSAYGSLRWFIPYSDIARLICTYYLYCANEFEAAEVLSKRRRGRLRDAITFFRDAKRVSTSASAAGTATRPGLPLLVALPDALSFQAIDALASGRSEHGLELVGVIRKLVTPNFDCERAERLSFLSARVFEVAGRVQSSRSIFEGLTHSPWPLVARAAAQRLNSLSHG